MFPRNKLKLIETHRNKMAANGGFTLIELLVVIFIVGTLTTIVTVNFREQRIQQEVAAAGQELVSKIRERQSEILAGKELAGSVPDAYEFGFTDESQTYTVSYIVSGNSTLLETVNLTENMRFSELRINDSAATPVNLRLTSPFGKIIVNGGQNRTLEIDLTHSAGGIVTVLVDGISGRIGIK